jgi:hypothetical protein
VTGRKRRMCDFSVSVSHVFTLWRWFVCVLIGTVIKEKNNNQININKVILDVGLLFFKWYKSV